ncbi:MAG: alpha/beta hydrolase [Myxococcales bacterium]|nr:alpha/beta hydrolase [Myxococcales bacterium]
MTDPHSQVAPAAPSERPLERPPPKAPASRIAAFARALALALVVLAALAYRPAAHHADAAQLLTRFSDSNARVEGLDEQETFVPTPRGPVRARVFAPRARAALPGVVLVHGVHYKGIDESRILRFARAVADTGVVVMLPEISELADYHVDPRSIDTVGAALRELSRRTSRGRVGLMGMSFGGGIALLTAADPRFAEHVGFVVAVGAHDDLGRILRFFATDAITLPDGTTRTQKAHGYGATVLVYNSVERLFAAPDVAEARLALRDWLQEKRDEARAHAAKTSPAAREKLARVFDPDGASLRPELVAMLDTAERDPASRAAGRAVSPHGNLGGLRAPTYLLHGEGDTVIPASETRWLEGQVPPGLLRQALVSPAIQHVEVHGEPTAREKWDLVHFMGEVLGDAHGMR